jgi:galactonate dehydratase
MAELILHHDGLEAGLGPHAMTPRQPDSPRASDATLARTAAVRGIGMDVGLDVHGRVRRPTAKPQALASCLQLAACTPNIVLREMSSGIHCATGGFDLDTCLADQSVLAGW